MKNSDYCCYPKCREYSSMIYLGKPLCEEHWEKSDNIDVRLKLKLPLYRQHKIEISRLSKMTRKSLSKKNTEFLRRCLGILNIDLKKKYRNKTMINIIINEILRRYKRMAY